MFYNVKRHSIILFGGINETGALDETWELALSEDLTGLTTINTTLPSDA
jgi:Galactose oxidase, central domain